MSVPLKRSNSDEQLISFNTETANSNKQAHKCIEIATGYIDSHTYNENFHALIFWLT